MTQVDRQLEVVGDLDVTGDDGTHRVEVADHPGLVHPDDVVGSQLECRQHTVESRSAVRRRLLKGRTDDILARQRQQQRPTQRSEPVERSEHLHRLRRRLAQVRARVDQHLLRSDARRDEHAEPLRQRHQAVLDRVVREFLGTQPHLRGRPVVGDDDLHAGVAHHVDHRRITQSRRVVHDRGARLDRRRCNRGAVGVDRDVRAVGAELGTARGDERYRSGDLVVDRDLGLVGAQRLPTDVEDDGAVRQMRSRHVDHRRRVDDPARERLG